MSKPSKNHFHQLAELCVVNDINDATVRALGAWCKQFNPDFDMNRFLKAVKDIKELNKQIA